MDTFCSNSANQDNPVFVFAQGTNGWSNLKKQKTNQKKKLDTYNVKNPPKQNIHLRIQLPPLKLETKINQTIFQIMLYECGFKVKNDSQQNIDEQEWSQWK